MAEYNSKRNDYYEDEISIEELIGFVLDRFKLVFIITLLGTLVGLAVALMSTPKFDVSATLKIEEPYGTETVQKYGGKVFNATQMLYDIFSRTNLEATIEKTPATKPDAKILYEDIEENLKYENIKETNNYTISVSKTADTEYWVAFINNLLDTVEAQLQDFRSEAENVKKTIEVAIADNETYLASELTDVERTAALSKASSLKSELRTVEVYIGALDSTVEWVSEPAAGTKKQNSGTVKICAIAFLCGGVIGVLLAFLLGFIDRHIYSSKKLKDLVDDKLVSSIPLYNKAEDLSSKEFEYITSKLNLTEDKKLSLLSLSPKAGNQTVEKGLKAVTKAPIVNLGTIADNPDSLSKLSAFSYTLVVLRAGIDNSVRIEKLMEDFKAVGVSDYGFVLNCVDVSDKNVTVYLAQDKYKHRKLLLESWKSYYKKNY